MLGIRKRAICFLIEDSTLINSREIEALTGGHAFGLLENRSLIEARGADRAAFLHNFCTNDVKALAPGHGCEAFFTNVQGKTICHALLFAADDSIWLSTDEVVRETLLLHLDKYLMREDVQLVDQSGLYSTYVVVGPSAPDGMRNQAGISLGHDLQHATLPNVARAWVAKVPFAEPTAFFMFCPQDGVAKLTSQWTKNGAVEVSGELLELARIHARFPRNGCEVTTDYLPQEVSRDELAISFTKGCYLGQETVARIDALGRVNKHLVGLQFDGSEAPPPDASLRLDDKIVGHVTSSCWSPIQNTAIALGYVRREVLENKADLFSDFGTAKLR